jgi:hypothetical protein
LIEKGFHTMFRKLMFLALGLTIAGLVSMMPVTAQTPATPQPTYTFYPTYTPLPTYTAYPTFTPMPSPTPTPTLSLPPDLIAPTMISLVDAWQVGSQYTHSSGQFSVADIPSWNREERGTLGDARVIYRHPGMFSIVEVSVQVWDGGDNLRNVKDWLDVDALWGIYDSWELASYEAENDKVVATYDLEFRELPFNGYVVVVPQGDFVAMVSIVVPTNANELPYLIQKLLVPTIIVYTRGIQNVPVDEG